MIFTQPAAKHETERYIYKRRNEDAATDRLQTKLKQEFYEKEFAKFENKGQVVGKNKYVEKRLSEFRYQARMELNQRRAKLAKLIADDHEAHKQEIRNLEETPEQVRQKMIARVAQLKSEKEDLRKAYVDKQMERRFLKNADELRKVDQEYNELKALQERNIQIMEKQHLQQEKYEEEMIYAALYKRDIAKKERQDQVKLQEIAKKTQERNQILGVQLDLNNQRKQANKDEISQEKQMLNNEWKEEDQRHNQQMEEQKRFLQNLNSEIKSTNAEQQDRKSYQKKIEKMEDKDLINSIIEKERMLDYLENEQKKKQQQETIEFMKNQAARNNEAEIFEKEAEILIAEQAEIQYQRQKAKWDAEEKARINLMYNVYDDRYKAVTDKQKYKEVEIQEKEVEKDILNKAVKEYEEECERKKIQEFQTNKNHQRNILGQVGEKQENYRADLNRKHMEEQEELRRQQEYETRIQAQKNKGKLLLDELRKQRPF